MMGYQEFNKQAGNFVIEVEQLLDIVEAVACSKMEHTTLNDITEG